MDKPGFTFSCSTTFMEAVRALDYKGQYKVCSVFYEESIKYPILDNCRYILWFDEIFERIDRKMLDE